MAEKCAAVREPNFEYEASLRGVKRFMHWLLIEGPSERRYWRAEATRLESEHD